MSIFYKIYSSNRSFSAYEWFMCKHLESNRIQIIPVEILNQPLTNENYTERLREKISQQWTLRNVKIAICQRIICNVIIC